MPTSRRFRIPLFHIPTQMKKNLITLFTIVLISGSVIAQSRSNADISSRIKVLNAGKFITLTFNGSTTTLRAVSDNFSDAEAKRSGILAMNFALGIIYAGDKLSQTPDKLLFSFWVLTKKPRFGEKHSLAFQKNGATVDIGDSRYVYKDRLDVEYLNFELSRDQLAVLATSESIRLGSQTFTFTASQKRIIVDILDITKVG